jgi:putative DNA-invertase from lambdoid prophage Rac
MSVYAYCRVSTAVQAEDGESLGVQERKIEGYAAMHDLKVDQVFVERGVSGGKPLGDRPEGAKLLALLKSGDVVIAAKLDRVFRSALDALQTCEAFRKRGIALHLLDLGGDVTGNGIAGLFMKIASAFADFERERIAERIRDVKADQRARGRYLGGSVPFGYRVEGEALVEVPEQQAAIRTMRDLREQGKSLRAIVSEVEARHGFKVSHMLVKGAFRAAG